MTDSIFCMNSSLRSSGTPEGSGVFVVDSTTHGVAVAKSRARRILPGTSMISSPWAA